MSYNKINYAEIKRSYVAKSLRAEQEAESRKRELCAKYAQIHHVEESLSQTGIKIMNAALLGMAGLEERILKLKEENSRLLKQRAQLLVKYGYPEDYFEARYECAVCKDEGHIDGKMCTCMKKALAELTFKSSGLYSLAQKQSFENFSLEYYKDNPEEYENMKYILESVKEFAENFGEGRAENILFCGTTGLGKTHLSTAAAVKIIEKGYDAVYETAINVFADFEEKRFGRYESEQMANTDKYFECDLLIIDDLGAELSNQFTVSCLYNIINTRLASGKSIIINTNLSQKELQQRYDNRIVSRLFGEFTVYRFEGQDVRLKKLMD